MIFTATGSSTSNRLRFLRMLATALLLGLPGGRIMAATTVPWHADLPEAQRASQLSGRPVLAIFTASWMAAAASIDRTVLASEEAVAVVAACYEPVCIDVDAYPEATRRAGVSRVPTACVLSADGRSLSKFELPDTPAEFVAAAAHAAQDAAFVAATAQSLPRSVAVEQTRSDRTLPRISGDGSTYGGVPGYDTRPATGGQARGIVPPGGRAITAVAAKVRMLSDFASTDCPTTDDGDAIAASFREAGLSHSSDRAPATSAAEQPAAATATLIANTPSVHPATSEGGAVTTTVATPVTSPTVSGPAETAAPVESLASSRADTPLGLESTDTAPTPPAAGAAAPWLGLPKAAPTIAPASPQPDSSTLATAPAAKVIEPQPSTDDKSAIATGTGDTDKTSQPSPAASTASSLLATLQKPFSMFTRQTNPRTDPQPARAEPAKMPAAEQTAAAATSAEPDVYGSMPVGLEGYCPVMLAERGVWVEGRAQWGARHRGRTYLFAGEQQQKAFLADPDRYAPALSGDDPVLAFDAGKSTPGQRRYGVTYQARMYLFSSPETRDAFAANPQRYTAGTSVAENRGTSVAAGGSVVR